MKSTTKEGHSVVVTFEQKCFRTNISETEAKYDEHIL